MVIDHLGIAVKSMELGIKHWLQTFSYTQATEIVVHTRQKVKVVFLEKNNSLPIKLIQPIDKSSPLYPFAQKGGGLHHICFKCANIDTEMERLKDEGLRVLVQPQPGEAFEDERIAFLFAKQGINIELIDTDKRAKRII